MVAGAVGAHVYHAQKMLIPVLICIGGIILENLKFRQDRSTLKARYIASERPVEKLSLLTGLVLNHSLVRWPLSFAVAASLVIVSVQAPGLSAMVKDAVDTGRVSGLTIDALLGLATSLLMTTLSLVARWVAR